jgi:carboxypeptidase Q
MRRWLSQVPSDIAGPIPVETSATLSRGIDAFSFSCAGAPAFSFSSASWEYETYTWHTDLDTFDKVVIDDVRSNAIVLAMLAYLASEDPTRLPRDAPPNPSIPCLASGRRSR